MGIKYPTLFLLVFTHRDKERGGGENQASLFDLQSSVGWISSGQDLKFIALTRATRGYKKKMRGFTEDQNEKFHRRSK